MTYKNRKSIRLKGYDYSQPGLYFVTIATQNREKLFGRVIDNQMQLNIAGKIIEKWFYELENKFANIKCHEMIVMPNHMHCIIQIVGTDVGADLCVCPNNKQNNTISGNTASPSGEHTGSPLHRVVQWFKTMTTNEYIKMVKQNILPPFDKHIWQRNYWEHIIRNEQSYADISNYIKTNPLKWDIDKLNRDYNE